MNNKIKCPFCNRSFEPTEAYKHELEEKLLQETQQQHKKDIEVIKLKIEKEASEKAQKDLSAERERGKKLTGQIDKLLSEIRNLRQKDEEREIEMKKKLLAEEEKIKEEQRKKSEEAHKLTDMEKDKKLNEALEQIETLKAKIQKGSQQTQGEVLELEIEEKLKQEFPSDQITEIKKGQRGADVSQIVVDKNGKKCGKILWESKNAKWSNSWISKLKEDQRQAKADVAILVSVHLPENVEYYSRIKGVWVCSWKVFLQLAYSLRFTLISLNFEKQTKVGIDQKMQILYEYLTGNEFKGRIEGIVESFSSLQEEMEREKRWFSTKWARQEKEIRKVLDHTHGMYGDLQGVIGKSLPEIKTLSLPESSDES
ncbi:DUF2130 domain-containing protein [Candidatus Woesebacteria bacterium]|nr:DUF2130 domain-containing protein [Candidatus Woesebacteria bacterium]